MDAGLILSITVGVLSILVVVLVGWNIATIVDVRKIRDDFALFVSNVENEIKSIKRDHGTFKSEQDLKFEDHQKWTTTEFNKLHNTITTSLTLALSGFINYRVTGAMMWALGVLNPYKTDDGADHLMLKNMKVVFEQPGIIEEILKDKGNAKDLIKDALRLLSQHSDEAVLLLSKFVDVDNKSNKS